MEVIKIKKFFVLIMAFVLTFTVNIKANADSFSDITKANINIKNSIESMNSNNIDKAKKDFQVFKNGWIDIEDGVKKQAIKAYGDVEEKMGMVQFLFSQEPLQKDKILTSLKELNKVNEDFISGKYSKVSTDSKITIGDLIIQLQKAKKQVENNETSNAITTMNKVSSSWLDVEGVVITQSQKVYNDAERDLVSIKGYLNMTKPDNKKALETIDNMYNYLSPLASKTSYTIMDSVTIILREGLEALLVVVALLGFLKKSGQEDKNKWIFGGVGVGIGISIVLAIAVQFIFTAGTFGNNNFLISGYTGIFSAVMLIYMSYWLHGKANISSWNNYIKDKGNRALATGSLFSLGFLAFLAVFREGTEIVLFYIGMASSISISDLTIGILIGVLVLVVISVLMLGVGVKIPMRPFFIASSILILYLGIKFAGMGINGLQLAGVIDATTSDLLPRISWLGIYPSYEGFIPQLLVIIGAVTLTIYQKVKIKN